MFESMLPNSLWFQDLRHFFTSFNFSLVCNASNSCHTFFTIFKHSKSVSQQFWNRKGFGPQFWSLVCNKGQWSDSHLCKRATFSVVNFEIHSGFTKSLSRILFELPRNQVKPPHEDGISRKWEFYTKFLKLVLKICEKKWLPLSFALSTSLKSPMMRHGSKLDFWYSETSLHNSVLPAISHGLYTLIDKGAFKVYCRDTSTYCNPVFGNAAGLHGETVFIPQKDNFLRITVSWTKNPLYFVCFPVSSYCFLVHLIHFCFLDEHKNGVMLCYYLPERRSFGSCYEASDVPPNKKHY